MRFADLTEIALNSINKNDILPMTQNSSGSDLKVKMSNLASWVTTKATYTFSNLGSSAKTLKAAIESLVPTTRTVNGHALSSNVTVTASDIGVANTAQYSAFSTSISLNDAEDKVLGDTGSLAAGTYLIIGEMYTGANDNGVGRRSVFLSKSGTTLTHAKRSRITVPACEACMIQVAHVETITAATTFYLCGYQNSGGALGVTGSLKWLKLH